ncbi:MAG: 16S rRNA (uracil(1498)-N(3))-methyltransferase [Cytophagaceae bacterium]
MSHLHFINNIETGVLDEVESGHVVRVLRKSEGDIISLTDGKGKIAEVKITQAHPKKCAFTILEVKEIPYTIPYSVHLVIAPPKASDRLEWMLEKLVETGVNEITFLQTEHSERKQINIDKLKAQVVSAIKQSGQAWMPQLYDMISFSSFIQNSQADQKYIAYLSQEKLSHLSKKAETSGKIIILIGPEGDFSESEINKAIQNGYSGVSLGDSILRTETAGFLAVNMIHLKHVLESN